MSDLDLSAATEAYTVANTPTYLFKRLRQDPAVQWAGTHLSIPELIERLKRAEEETARSPSASIEACVYLVALSFKELPEYEGFLKEYEAPSVYWFSPVKQQVLASYRPTRIVTLQAGPLVEQQTIVKSDVYTKSLVFNVGPQ